jgi:hypothetical protein
MALLDLLSPFHDKIWAASMCRLPAVQVCKPFRHHVSGTMLVRTASFCHAHNTVLLHLVSVMSNSIPGLTTCSDSVGYFRQRHWRWSMAGPSMWAAACTMRASTMARAGALLKSAAPAA